MSDIRETYIQWLEAKIHEHQTEVARLSVALEVFLEMPVRRLEGAVERTAKQKKRVLPRAASRQVEQHILNLMNESKTPAYPIDILHTLGISSDKAARRPWYNALSRLVKQGALTRTDVGLYSLPYSKDPAVPAA